jgi:hypothetical protein
MAIIVIQDKPTTARMNMHIDKTLGCYLVLIYKEEKRNFTVHAAMIAYHSRTLGALINKHLSRAKVSCALQ